MIGHFPEGAVVTDVLTRCRARGIGFDDAWALALHRARRGRQETNPHWLDAELGLRYACAAFRRAYEGEPPTREDQVARGLLDAMVAMYDDSADAETAAVMEQAA